MGIIQGYHFDILWNNGMLSVCWVYETLYFTFYKATKSIIWEVLCTSRLIYHWSMAWDYINCLNKCLFCTAIQSTLVISNSKGHSEILRDIRTSTHQICRIEEKLIRLTTFNKYMCNWTLEVRYIYWKYCGKEEKLLLRSNFSSFPQYFLHFVRFSCLGRDQIFTSR